MATTYKLTRGGANEDFSEKHGESKWQTKLLEATLDCSKHNLGAADVAELIDIPAQTFVHKVFWSVEKAEGSAVTFDIGDGSDTDGYVDGANGNSVASGVNSLTLTEATPNTVTGYSNGKYYSAADTIDVLAVAAVDAMVLRVAVLVTFFAG